MNVLFQTLLASTAGAVILANGLMFDTDKILNEAKTAANLANLHQIATVLEIYYLDHNYYPEARGGAAMLELLGQENYIMNKPLNPDIFFYERLDAGQNYVLKLN